MSSTQRHILHVLDHYFPEGNWRECRGGDDAVLGYLHRSEFDEVVQIVIYAVDVNSVGSVAKSTAFTKSDNHQPTYGSAMLQHPELAVLESVANFLRTNKDRQ